MEWFNMRTGNPCAPRSVLSRSAIVAGFAVAAAAIGSGSHAADGSPYFRHLATFDVMARNGSAVAEIIDASPDGRQLVYTDSPNQSIGFVGLLSPASPTPQGTLNVGGEPTSLVVRNNHVLVAVNTSESFTNPSGKLVVVDRLLRTVVAVFELGGQPDSIALAPNRRRAAIVIENERDEDLNDGLLPQAPSGKLLIVDLRPASPNDWTITEADLSPVAAAATNGGDLEPEYVDINRQNEAVVTFQENNHIAVVNLLNGQTISHFPAGTVSLTNVDAAEDDLISLDTNLEKRREPDAVTWLDDDTFAIANEGDYENASGEEGGSRGFTIFDQQGNVVYESAESFEHWLVRAGHYNEARSENKGVEPEGIESGLFGTRNLLFVGSERSNAVGVYDVTANVATPETLQLLPTGIGPEGLKAIPKRRLFVVSTETDEAGIGIPTMINIYGLRDDAPRYPMIESDDDLAGLPIPWVALSGLVGDPADANTLYAVSDAFLAKGFIYTLDVSAQPATIVERLEVSGADDLDLEGIAVGPDGSFWLASEGAGPTGRANRVLKVNSTTGAVEQEIALPAGLEDQRRSNGYEGIAVTGTPGAEVIYVAIQRAWPDEGDIDRVNTKIGRYEVATGTWTFVHYPLQPQGQGDWIGLSELTLLPDGTFAVIERDKGWGPTTGFNAELKALFRVDLENAAFRAYDDPSGLVTVRKRLLRNLLPALQRNSVWTTEKLEGFAMAADGRAYVVTDNDGVDGATGETVFLNLGTVISDKLSPR
jgi:hypothetical protein